MSAQSVCLSVKLTFKEKKVNAVKKPLTFKT